MTLIGQREKLSRDDLTSMIDFIKAHLDDEDGLLSAIPRFEMPKTDFES